MDVLTITLTIAGAAALLNLWLGMRVSQLRIRDKVAIGDGGNARIAARMRAHANFVEYVPTFLILSAWSSSRAGRRHGCGRSASCSSSAG